MDFEKLFDMWSKDTGMPREELAKIWQETVTDLQAQGINDERIQTIEFGKTVRKKIWVQEHGTKRKEPTSFEGFIIGATRLVDTDEFKRRAAAKAYNEDPMEAQLKGLTDASGIPLDTKETVWRFGKEVDNPNFHKPLTGHTYTRTIWGVCKKADGQPKMFKLTLWRGTAKSFVFKPFVPVLFSANIKTETTFFDLTPSKLTKFSGSGVQIPMEEWIRTASKIFTLDLIEDAFAQCQTSRDNPAMVEGDVDRINMDVNPSTNSRSIIIIDNLKSVKQVRVFVPADYPMGFHEGSRVIVLGRVTKWKRQDEDEERVSMESYGVFPIPGLTMEKPYKVEGAGLPAEGKDEEPDLEIPWEA